MPTSLTQSQFDVLHALARADEPLTQCRLHEATGMSLGSVNAAVRELEARGCVVGRRRITDAGLEALKPYRVDNAVMAAGLSERFAPISYEHPKGTLRVRGEILSERQIRQLHEAGITDVAVVGCKKEYFFHLAEQFGATIGGRDAWIMLGHAYFDRAFSAAFTRIPEEVYDLPRTAPLLRESIYLDHVKELDMVIRRYPAGVINEFDSVDEIRGFDPMLMENVDSKVIGIISSALGCAKSQIHDFYPLKQGITNPFCHFAVDDREYVYRHPGIGTDKIIDRRAETASLELVGEWLFIYYRHAADHVDRLLAEYESAARATAKGARA